MLGDSFSSSPHINVLSMKKFYLPTPNNTQLAIDVLSYWAWRCITSFIDHAIQIYVGQKGKANQWKVTVLEEFLHAVLLYQ